MKQRTGTRFSATRRQVVVVTILSCCFPALVGGCSGFGFEWSVKPGINDSYKNANVDDWIVRFEGESREIYKHRDRILEAVGLQPGMTVADIGSGTGFFTLAFAGRVKPDGKVLAVDITPEFLKLIDERAAEFGLTNVETVHSKARSATLPAGSVDLVFICDVYHHFEYPMAMMRSIHKALRPGGQLVIIDFERIVGVSRDWILGHVRAGKGVVTDEVTSSGFRLVAEVDASYLAENYYLRFEKVGE